ncbi:MAG: HipA domain-containing protein [Rikenellaceae bacterium]
MNKCLYCYKELREGQVDFHPHCTKKIFGSTKIPSLPYQRNEIKKLATQVIRSQTTVTGVQAKLSLQLSRGKRNEPERFTIVGLWGTYILKPQSDHYPMLPEVEDLTMHLAELAKIETAQHSLIRFADGELCYLTKRFDRKDDSSKLPMEDMCQLSQRLTEYKYKGSYEQIAKLILKYSSTPKLDVVNYWEQVLFSWIVGNADMHLKNYSLLGSAHRLSPAYDLVSTALVLPSDNEELALTLNGRKRKISRSDFVKAMQVSEIEPMVMDKIFVKFTKMVEKWNAMIDISFLTQEMKEQYKAIIQERIGRL